MPKKNRRTTLRRTQMETLESRQMMSADPIGGMLGGAVSHHAIQEEVQQHFAGETPPMNHHGAIELDHHTMPPADFWLDEAQPLTPEDQFEQIEKALYSAHQLTGMDHVKTDYGFSGAGQTVAVIDSGIAYDHYALGDGYGSNYRVVGGWDFAENDADPYDGAPPGQAEVDGSHGTHVAGIIGADDGTRSGVAPDVDLVGLRVFDDDGAGYFSWVEDALQWVHDNRDAFDNPITAVNLSLGTSYNADSIPYWATLEEEFAQLEADGIFIAVSAGNSYTTYNTPGLSYPAASSHVVPVMSSDDSGMLSYFSQRHSRAISAPGRFIYSTVPDYAGNNNGVTDDWANFSGTSMASPYVAGASVIIREAMEFVGYTNITQDTIYDHMVDTADSFYDNSTGAYYNRLNVQSAIDALMPEDDFGSSVNDAYQLGTISAGLQTQAAMAPMNGHIASLSDADYFTFTAGATGTVTFSAANTTHQMDAAWQGMGGDGWTDEGGDSYTMNVVAGQEYTIALSSDDGLGYYDLSITADSAFTYTDWGTTATQETKQDLTAGTETYYRIQTGQAGYVTAEALYASGNVDMALLNANLEIVATDAADRLDYYAAQGEELYVRVSGSAADVDVRITNAVSLAGGVVTVTGTADNDAMSYTEGATRTVSINDVGYSFAAASATQFNINGGGGNDTIAITGGSGDESAVLRKGSVTLTGSTYQVQSQNVETASINSGAGDDRAYLFGAAGNDLYESYSDRVVMSGQGYTNTATGFGQTYAYADSPGDTAAMYGGPGDDLFRGYEDRSIMSGADYYNRATGFQTTLAYADSAGDEAHMYGGAGDDLFRSYSDRAVLSGDGYYTRATGFQYTLAFANSSGDEVHMYGGAGDDLFRSYTDRSVISNNSFYSRATGFAYTLAFADSAGDQAHFYGGAGDDLYRAYQDRVVMSGADYYSRASGFQSTIAFADSAGDQAHMYGGAGADLYRAYSDRVVMSGSDYYNRASGFSNAYGYADSTDDTALLYGGNGDDLYLAYFDYVKMSDGTYSNRAIGFSDTTGFGGDGNDSARMYDSAYDDSLEVASAGVAMAFDEYGQNEANGFEDISAYLINGGDDSTSVASVDYAFNLVGE